MKTIECLVSVSLASLFALTSVVGCASKNTSSDEESLGSSEDQLVTDNDEVEDADADQESGIDDSLSGASVADPGSPAMDTDDAARADKIKTNPGKFFTPAGCLVTTVSGNTATHVFTNCTGPYGLKTFSGTITSSYVVANGELTVTHAAQNFSINDGSISGQRVVVYTKAGNVITKHRTGDWSGTTGKGKPIEHQADFTSTWDADSKCVTRDGSAHTQIGGRELDVTVEGYKRCGVGNLGCPESGTITLARTKGDKSNSVTLDFLGGKKVKLTGPKGGTITRGLLCRAS